MRHLIEEIYAKDVDLAALYNKINKEILNNQLPPAENGTNTEDYYERLANSLTMNGKTVDTVYILNIRAGSKTIAHSQNLGSTLTDTITPVYISFRGGWDFKDEIALGNTMLHEMLHLLTAVLANGNKSYRSFVSEQKVKGGHGIVWSKLADKYSNTKYGKIERFAKASSDKVSYTKGKSNSKSSNKSGDILFLFEIENIKDGKPGYIFITKNSIVKYGDKIKDVIENVYGKPFYKINAVYQIPKDMARGYSTSRKLDDIISRYSLDDNIKEMINKGSDITDIFI